MGIMDTEKIYEGLGISREVWEYGQRTESRLKERFEEFDKNAEYNQMKVIRAMQENRVSEGCFNYVSGYGYNDLGRDTLESVYAVGISYRGSPGTSTDYLWNACTGTGTGCQSASGR